MSGKNSAILAGNIATEPELRHTANTNTPVCQFVLAINRPRSASDAADFISVNVFGEDAETVMKYKEKGHGVKVEGRLDYQSWKTDAGATRSTVKMIARKGGVTFLPKGSAISVNKVFLMGNLTRDPELITVGNDIDKANFSLAVDGIEREGGESDTDYFDIVAWRGLAEVLSTYKVKGDLIHLEGRVSYSSWEKDGAKRSRIEVVAEDAQFLPSKNQASGQASGQANATAKAQAGAQAGARAASASSGTAVAVEEIDEMDDDQYDEIDF